MPAPVQGIGAAQALTELFALPGKMPLVLDTTIVPVVSVGDLGDDVRWGPRAFGSIIEGGGGAGFVNKFELALPVMSDTIGLRAYIEWIDVQCVALTGLYVRPSPGLATPTSTGLVAWADTRKRGLPQLLMTGRNNLVGTGVLGVYNMELAAGQIHHVDLGWIIGQHPDTGAQQGIFIEGTQINTTMKVSACWREGTPR